MIFCLDIILIINLVVAYRYFKDCVAPPVLLGGGMLLAALVSTLYYNEWQMENFLLYSVLILGFGPCFFTLCCILLKRKRNTLTKVESTLNFTLVVKPLSFLIIVAGINCIYKVILYKSAFGSFLNFSELLFAARMDAWTGDNYFHFPQIVVWISSTSTFYSYISTWLLAYCLIHKKKEFRKVQWLSIAHLFLVSFDGLLYGAKGSMIEPVMRFIFVYFCLWSVHFRGSNISFKKLVNILMLTLVFAFSFKSLTSFIGRDVDGKNNSDMLSVYCGAQIKNFDIYMHGGKLGQETHLFGGNTFSSFYVERGEKESGDTWPFQSVGMYALGNVYTQYCNFHLDFGGFGVFVISLLMACWAMFLYNRAYKQKAKINIYLLLYSGIAFPLFMSFFAANFTSVVCRLGYIKVLFYISLFTWITNKYLIKNEIKNTSLLP